MMTTSARALCNRPAIARLIVDVDVLDRIGDARQR
jgi:hypothetical protein